MSSKPTTVATWDSNGTNTTTITGGHATDGYANSAVPTSSEFNTLLRLAGLWQQYLNDGFLDGLFGLGTSGTGIITPPTISTANPNYNPTGLSGASVIRQDVSDDTNGSIGGLVGGTEGRIVIFHNLQAAGGKTLHFLHEDVGSTAANRFFLPGDTTLIVSVRGSVGFRYDGTSSRWRCLFKGF